MKATRQQSVLALSTAMLLLTTVSANAAIRHVQQKQLIAPASQQQVRRLATSHQDPRFAVHAGLFAMISPYVSADVRLTKHLSAGVMATGYRSYYTFHSTYYGADLRYAVRGDVMGNSVFITPFYARTPVFNAGKGLDGGKQTGVDQMGGVGVGYQKLFTRNFTFTTTVGTVGMTTHVNEDIGGGKKKETGSGMGFFPYVQLTAGYEF
jgi:hypothetical protein